MNIDNHGLITQADGDGGDTAQRMGMYWFGWSICSTQNLPLPTPPDKLLAPKPTLKVLEVAPGEYVRHPFQGPEWDGRGETFRNDRGEFSRDQTRPLVMMMGAWKLDTFLSRQWDGMIMRLFRCQNGDILGPYNFGEYIRAFRNCGLYPLLLVTDFILMVYMPIHCLSLVGKPDDSDDNNIIMTLLQAQYVMATPFSFLARKLYKKLKPRGYGNTKMGETSAVMGSLVWYHRKENGGNPEIAELYRPLVENM